MAGLLDPTKQQAIDKAFQDVLGRAPTQAGYDYWGTQSWESPDQLFDMVRGGANASGEKVTATAKQDAINDAYRGVLGRDVDPVGQDYWSGQTWTNDDQLRQMVAGGAQASGETGSTSGTSWMDQRRAEQDARLEAFRDSRASSQSPSSPTQPKPPTVADIPSINFDQYAQEAQARIDQGLAQYNANVSAQLAAQRAEWERTISQFDPANLSSLSPVESLNQLLSSNSAYLQRARTQAGQAMAARGLNNSSMAVGAAEGAAIDRAAPIAISDAELANARWREVESARANMYGQGMDATIQNALQRQQLALGALTDINQFAFSGALQQNQNAANAALQQNNNQWGLYRDQAGYAHEDAMLDKDINERIRYQTSEQQHQSNLQILGHLQDLEVVDKDFANQLTMQGNEHELNKYLANLDRDTKLEVASIDSNSRMAVASAQIASSERITNSQIAASKWSAEYGRETAVILEDYRTTREEAADERAFSYEVALGDHRLANDLVKIDSEIEFETWKAIEGADREDARAFANAQTLSLNTYSSELQSIYQNPELSDDPAAMRAAITNAQDRWRERSDYNAAMYGVSDEDIGV